jgi:hypothetical protein
MTFVGLAHPANGGLMQDVIYIAIVVVFFGVMALFTTACDRIIGSDDSIDIDSDELDNEPVQAAA